MSDNKRYYRPEWTCGRYNAEKHVAIYYNLIAGMSYFFESYSADIIGIVLNVGRKGYLDLDKISLDTGISRDSIDEFFNILYSAKLVDTNIASDKEIQKYREFVRFNRKIISDNDIINDYQDYSSMNADDAEDAYIEAVGGVTGVMLELTYLCSEQCIHCYNLGAKHDETEVNKRGDRIELALEDYRRIIDEFIEQGLIRVCLTGGDPFSKPIVWDIIEYLYLKDIAIDIYTNGQNLIGKVDRLAKYYPKIVGVSIYSAVPEVHDKITRTKGSLIKTLSVMQRLCELAVPMYLKCCVLNINFETYQTVYKLARDYNAMPQIEINIRNTVDGNKYASRNLRLTDEQYESLFKDKHIYPNINEYSLSRVRKRNRNESTCKAGKNSFNVTPEGNLIPCCAFHHVFGNLKDEHLSSILNSDKLKIWRKTILSQFLECDDHDYCSFCSICAGENYSENSTPFLPAENKCFLAKKRYEYACKIHSKTNGDV